MPRKISIKKPIESYEINGYSHYKTTLKKHDFDIKNSIKKHKKMDQKKVKIIYKIMTKCYKNLT